MSGEQSPASRGPINDPFVAWLPVATAGYTWVLPEEAPDAGDAVLAVADQDGIHEPDGARLFAPLAVPDLHRRFARIQPTRAGILAFADQYGELGHGRLSIRLAIDGEPLGQWGNTKGETLGQWRRAIGEVRGLLTLWSLIQQRNGATLGRFVRKVEWQKGDAAYVAGLAFTARGLDVDGSRLASEGAAEAARPRVFNRDMGWNEDSLAEALDPRVLTVVVGRSSYRGASWYGDTFAPNDLRHWDITDIGGCNPGLDQPQQPSSLTPPGSSEPPRTVTAAARSLLLAIITSALGRHISVHVSDAAPGGFAVVPDCLSAAIYLAVALEVIGRTHPVRRCASPSCHQPYTPNHARRRYCSDACRKRHFRAERSVRG